MGTEAPAKTLPIETQEYYKIKLLLLVNMLFAVSIFLGCGLEVWTGALQDCSTAGQPRGFTCKIKWEQKPIFKFNQAKDTRLTSLHVWPLAKLDNLKFKDI